MKIKICFLTLLFFISLRTLSQNDKPIKETEIETDVNTEQQLESLSEELENESIDFSQWLEEKTHYAQQKINLNNLDYDALEYTFNLTDYQIYNLKKHRESYGTIYSVYELLTIEGFDRETVERLLPYLEVGNTNEQKQWHLKTAFKYGKNRIVMRYGQILEKQQGYFKPDDESKSHYLGSPQALLLKYTFNYKNKLRFGFVAEKDAGEEFFKGSNKYGFDFYSFHLFLNDVGKLKALAVGDYHLSFGQGLAINTGFALQKPINAVSIKYNAGGLKPYSSANEYNFLRGIASTIDCKVLYLTLFYSFKSVDAATALASDTLENEFIYIENLQQTGYHRTPNEIANKNSVYQHLAGLHVDIPFRTAKIGTTVFYTHFNRPLQRNLSFYNMFAFNEQNNLNASVDYTALYKKVSFFGEIAMSKSPGFASLNGMTFHLHPLFSVSVSHRYYSKNYQSLNSAAFGQSTNNSAEHGFFVGTNLIISKHWSVDAYVDYFHFNWLKYRIDAPSDGFEVQTKLKFYLNRRFAFYVRFNYKTKAINEDLIHYNQLTETHKQNYRLHLDYLPLPWLTLKSRLEIVNYRPSTSSAYRQGYCIYQDVAFRFQRIPLTLSTRFSVFDTYSYDERIYTYENDVLYAFSIPSFYGKGCRVYLVGKVSIGRRFDFWFKVAQTFYRGRHTIGSGLELINTNHKTEVKAEAILKF